MSKWTNVEENVVSFTAGDSTASVALSVGAGMTTVSIKGVVQVDSDGDSSDLASKKLYSTRLARKVIISSMASLVGYVNAEELEVMKELGIETPELQRVEVNEDEIQDELEGKFIISALSTPYDQDESLEHVFGVMHDMVKAGYNPTFEEAKMIAETWIEENQMLEEPLTIEAFIAANIVVDPDSSDEGYGEPDIDYNIEGLEDGPIVISTLSRIRNKYPEISFENMINVLKAWDMSVSEHDCMMICESWVIREISKVTETGDITDEQAEEICNEIEKKINSFNDENLADIEGLFILMLVDDESEEHECDCETPCENCSCGCCNH